MEIKGNNDAYSLKIEKISQSKVAVTIKDIALNMMGIVIELKDLKKLMEAIENGK